MDDALRRTLTDATHLRFLCSGNVVRSAFCELLGRNRGLPWELDSAATRFHNAALFPETRAALLERGLEPAELDTFRPRHLDVLDDPPPGLVAIGMAEEHLAFWRDRWDSPTVRIAALVGETAHVADPVLEGAPFEATFTRLERCLVALEALTRSDS